jgi:hypothetical protein
MDIKVTVQSQASEWLCMHVIGIDFVPLHFFWFDFGTGSTVVFLVSHFIHSIDFSL